MSRRILMLGNSHLAAPRLAGKRWPDRWPDLEITAIGGGVPVLEDLRVDNGVLRGEHARTDEVMDSFVGADHLSLDGIDAVVIVGAQMGPIRLIELPTHCTWPGRPSLARVPDLASMERVLTSDRLIRTAARDAIESSTAIRLARRLGPATGLPILICSQPRPSAALMQRPRSAFRRVRRLVESGEGAVLSDLFEETAEAAVCDAGARYLPQPSRTIKDAIMTVPRFANGAQKLRPGGARPQPADDLLHGNDVYGAQVMDQITGAVATVG